MLAVTLVGMPLVAQQPILPPYKSGFPVQFSGHQNSVGSQPMAADLGLTPGFKSIIFGLFSGRLYVLQRNGASSWGAAPGWPVTLPGHIFSSPAVGDLDNDGSPYEIVVGYGSTFTQSTQHGGARAYRRNGTQLWEVQTLDVTPGPANGLRDPVQSTPAVGDIDGDGTVEVVFGALDHRLYVVNGENGQPNGIPWPKDMRDTVFSSPALHDIDGDGRLDIIIGTDSHQEGPPINSIDGGCLHVLRYDGTEVAGFPKCVNQVISSSPAVGDIDGDGQPEIVHGTGTFWGSVPGHHTPTKAVYAWNCDGTSVTGWPVTSTQGLQGQVANSPTLVNIDADAPLEVLVTDIKDPTPTSEGSGDEEYRLYAFNGNGAPIFQARPRDFFNLNLSAGNPLVGDVLGDAALEILVTANGEVAVFSLSGTQLTEDGTTKGTPAQKISFMTQASLSNVAVTDLETDGAGSKIEVIAVSATPFPSFTHTEVHVWNPVSRATPSPWGFFHRDEKRWGVAAGTPACGGGTCQGPTPLLDFFTLTPCRVVDTRNPAGPYGGPALASGGVRNFVMTGVCGVPSAARAVSLNVTVVGSTGGGFVRFSPGCQLPSTSIINFSTGQTRGNNAVLALGAGGILTAGATVQGSGTVHLIIDVNGFFQ